MTRASIPRSSRLAQERPFGRRGAIHLPCHPTGSASRRPSAALSNSERIDRVTEPSSSRISSVLAARITEVLPRRMPGAHEPRHFDRDAFVDDVFAQRRATSGFPVRVVAIGLVDERTDLAPARWRRVTHGVSHFVRQPHGNQLRIEAETLRLLVGHAGEVLEAHERHATTSDNKLAGVGRTDADHEDDIDVDIAFEQCRTLRLRAARERRQRRCVRASTTSPIDPRVPPCAPLQRSAACPDRGHSCANTPPVDGDEFRSIDDMRQPDRSC